MTPDSWRASLKAAAAPPSLCANVWQEALTAFASGALEYVSARTLASLLGVTTASFERAWGRAGGTPLILLERQLHQASLGAPVTSQAAWAPAALDPWLLLTASDEARLQEVIRRALDPFASRAPLPPVHGGRSHDPTKTRRHGQEEGTLLLWEKPAPKPTPVLPYPRRFWAIDIETTGSSNDDRITELGMVLFVDGEPVGVHSTLLDPEGRRIPAMLEKKIGITNAMCKGQRKFSEIAKKVHRSLVGEVVVWHSTANFDRRMIKLELERCGLTWPPTAEEIDTQGEARRLGLPQALNKLCQHLCIDLGTHHRAAHDAAACGRALVAMRTGATSSTLTKEAI